MVERFPWGFKDHVVSVSVVWTGSSGTVYVVSGGWTLVSDSDGHDNRMYTAHKTGDRFLSLVSSNLIG